MSIETAEGKVGTEGEEGGAGDGVENPTNQEGNEAGLEPGAESNQNAGGEAGGLPEDNGGDGQGTGEEEGGGQPDPIDPRDEAITTLKTEIEQLKQKVNQGVAPVPRPQPVVFTPEQREQISQRFGGVPFEAVQGFGGMIENAVKQIETKMEQRFGQYTKRDAIEELSKEKGFEDIKKYSKDVDEYINRFAPIHWGNKEVIREAVRYARGKNMEQTIRKVTHNTERNLRVATTARPASSTASRGGKPAVKLTEAEESAYQSFGKKSGMTREQYVAGLRR